MKNRGLLGKLALVSIGGCLLLAIFSPSFVRAQSYATEDWEKAAGGKMTFEVSSVKQRISAQSAGTLDAGDASPSNGGFFSASGLRSGPTLASRINSAPRKNFL
jgi:hypothetical protein